MTKTNRIISLGYNCEVSFRLEDYFDKLDSYLFSWSYECDRDLFIEALKNVNDVFTDDISLMDDHMFKCNKYNIKFHPRYDIIPKFGEASEDTIREAKEELTQRLAHLKSKMVAMFEDDAWKTFLLKVEDKGEEDNIKFIKDVSGALQELINDGTFTLVAILEKDACSSKILALEDEKLKIRTLKKFANVKHTDISGDINGWKCIIKEFALNHGKNFRKNLFIRRKTIIPAMFRHKLKKLIGRQ